MKKKEKNTIHYESKWVLFILTAILLATYLYKKDKKTLNSILFNQQPSAPMSSKIFDVASEQQIEELDEKIRTLRNEFEKKTIELGQSDEQQKKRNALIGMIINENFYILKNKMNLKDVLYLNPDWTIDRLPKHVKIENTEEVEKYLKENQ